MIADAIQILSGLHTELFGSLTFFLGFLMGHRLQLGRDRMREFNTAVVPVRTYLLKEIEMPRQYVVPEPTLIQMDAFEHYLYWRHRAGFRRAWEEQERERAVNSEYDPITGTVKRPFDPTLLRIALRNCLKYTKRR